MPYDVVIVGTGSAGAILANRLSADRRHTVLLLEAGPDYPHTDDVPVELRYGYGPDTQPDPRTFDWGFVGFPTRDAGRTILIPRGKVTGGSSAVNAHIFLRGLADDFHAWAAAGNRFWNWGPELLETFCALEHDLDFANDSHGQHGPITIRRFPRTAWRPEQEAFYEACLAAGFPACRDLNAPDAHASTGPLPLNIAAPVPGQRDGLRQSTARCYLPSEVRQRANLTIWPDCLVQRLLLAGHRAIGVQLTRQGQPTEIQGAEIILSAGAIGSPHLLMLSGIGPAQPLRALGMQVRHELPGVGKNLRDHPAVEMRWSVKDTIAMDRHQPKHQVGLRYTADGSPHHLDMIVYMVSRAEHHAVDLRPTINLAASAGELALVSSDPHIQPLLHYHYLEEACDTHRLLHAMRLCEHLVETSCRHIVCSRLHPGAADLRSDARLETWLFDNVTTGHHSSGTCKMGPASDPLAVVDQHGRVHGLDGLRVVDASIMPDCVRANINATVMMMAERLARWIGARG